MKLDHHYFYDLNDSSWKPTNDGGRVFTDPCCKLKCPHRDASVSMDGAEEHPYPGKREFTIAKVGSMYRLRLRADDERTYRDIPRRLYPDLVEAFAAFCEWYNETRAPEILADAEAELAKHGYRLENPKMIRIE